MARKKQRSALLQSNLDYIRKSGRSIQALFFVAAFGVIGGGGWLAFGASAADNVYRSEICALKSGGGNVSAQPYAYFDNTAGNNGAQLSSFFVEVPGGWDLQWSGSNRSALYVTPWKLGANGKPVATSPQTIYLTYKSINDRNGRRTYQAINIPTNLTHVYSMAMKVNAKDSGGTLRSCTTKYFSPYHE